MVVILVKAAQALRVDHQYVHLLARLREARDGCAPDVDAFRARVDAGSDAEPALSIEQDAIQKVAFACAVHSSDRDDADGSSYMVEDLDGLSVDLEH